jgi:hypothetical protein
VSEHDTTLTDEEILATGPAAEKRAMSSDDDSTDSDTGDDADGTDADSDDADSPA